MTEELTTKNETVQSDDTNKTTCFSFDNPQAVDSSSWMTDYCDLFYNDMDDYWETPISLKGLADISNVNGHHGSLLKARSNYVSARFVKGGGMSPDLLNRASWDYFGFGHFGLLKIRNRLGKVIGLTPLPMMHIRKRKNGDFVQLLRDDEQKVFKAKDVIFAGQYDPQQQIYGLPDYLGSLQSALLNLDATLFRRAYYKNGAHMGYIFYTSDPNLSDEDDERMQEALQGAKGPGNFRSMYINIPNGKEKGVQIIPVGDIATKDDFERVKNISTQDVFAGHRFPAGMGGMMPEVGANMPDPIKVSTVYDKYEVVPVCKVFMRAVNNDPEIPKRLHFEFDVVIGYETDHQIGR
ncbi:phage portal protein [uncultured Vibrio sp.]|uniref:phage portal protein n=1 Tax=uncultured Vibrio sp. TaxID=114054 RepID=UPI0025DDC05A|nr:phage portal protein [uncultured Vibrio sp.]